MANGALGGLGIKRVVSQGTLVVVSDGAVVSNGNKIQAKSHIRA